MSIVHRVTLNDAKMICRITWRQYCQKWQTIDLTLTNNAGHRVTLPFVALNAGREKKEPEKRKGFIWMTMADEEVNDGQRLQMSKILVGRIASF